jgi:hypothetical protein
MVQETAPVRRQLGARGKMQRRKRIFARLREGASYEEIAAEEGIASGDVSAITPYLKVLDRLDRLDRYQTVACANQVYDDEARKKLMDRIDRMAENFGINEDFAAALRAHLKKTGKIPGDEPYEADAAEGLADPAGEEQQGQSEAANWMSV